MRKDLEDAVMSKLAACKCKKKAACKNAQQIKPVQLNAACPQNKCAAQKLAEQFAAGGLRDFGYTDKQASATPAQKLMLQMAYRG